MTRCSWPGVGSGLDKPDREAAVLLTSGCNREGEGECDVASSGCNREGEGECDVMSRRVPAGEEDPPLEVKEGVTLNPDSLTIDWLAITGNVEPVVETTGSSIVPLDWIGGNELTVERLMDGPGTCCVVDCAGATRNEEVVFMGALVGTGPVISVCVSSLEVLE